MIPPEWRAYDRVEIADGSLKRAACYYTSFYKPKNHSLAHHVALSPI